MPCSIDGNHRCYEISRGCLFVSFCVADEYLVDGRALCLWWCEALGTEASEKQQQLSASMLTVTTPTGCHLPSYLGVQKSLENRRRPTCTVTHHGLAFGGDSLQREPTGTLTAAIAWSHTQQKHPEDHDGCGRTAECTAMYRVQQR